MNQPTIGELRHRLRLEQASRTGDGGGGGELSWQLIAEVWASVRQAGGGEAVHAERRDGRVASEIWIRHRDGVVPAMRFNQVGRIHDIRAVVDPDGRRRWLRCLCEERIG